ncbi:glycosyltransferase [Haloglomus litoreum]|uniref:glycosyltransferase n=1 Tax=Haloglomus litoreum TaxID=3034026 RepID=UPI0023E7DB0B|nr:glycosyltransferase [Haloglomus sp. DT116]
MRALRPSTPAAPRELLERPVFGLVVVAVLGTGYLQGALSMVVGLPAALGGGSVVVLQAVVACLSIAGLFTLSAVVLFGQVAGGGADRLPTTGPTVTAVVPVHRDAAALHRSVESLLGSRYEDLRVVIVAEPGDEASIERAREYASDNDRVELLINDRYPGSKAGAVNYAAEVTESEHVAVFDVDERVDPRFVPAAVAALDDCDVVQGRTIPEPDGLIETVAYYESVVLGDLSQRLLTAITDFTVAASRTVVMRRAAFETVGGYDPEMLTEDYAFAFACYEAGLDVVEQFPYASLIEAAHSPIDWWGQRKRWMTGYAQVLHGLVAGCTAPKNYRTLVSPVICAGSVIGNLFMLSLVPKMAVLVVNGVAAWVVLPVLALVGVALAMRAYDARAGRLDGIGVGALVTPVVLPLYSLAGIKAVVEYLLGWDGAWYSVAKGA